MRDCRDGVPGPPAAVVLGTQGAAAEVKLFDDGLRKEVQQSVKRRAVKAVPVV